MVLVEYVVGAGFSRFTLFTSYLFFSINLDLVDPYAKYYKLEFCNGYPHFSMSVDLSRLVKQHFTSEFLNGDLKFQDVARLG